MNRTTQFEKTILPHEPSLYGPAMALTHSSAEAEDLVQETLVRAFDRFDTFRADGSPRAWLHTIMRNLFYNAYRKKSREPRQISLDSFDASSGHAADALMDASVPQQKAVTSPERLVLSQLEGSAILSAVQSLPSDYREVVVLADVQGMAYQEIADQLHIPVGTVRSRLSRGRERVRRSLAAWRISEERQPVRLALAA
ncbi:MAG: sigma-70 family RNA polymerase sigma factor [Armatimonas sp.]